MKLTNLILIVIVSNSCELDDEKKKNWYNIRLLQRDWEGY